jgi:hypothetical protein
MINRNICAIGILVILISVSTYFPYVNATSLTNDVKNSLKLIRENNRSIERIGVFAEECTSILQSGDLSKISTCGTVMKKFNIDIGSFFSENKAVIEEMIYPYSIPANATNVLGQDSSSVVSSNDTELVGKDGMLAVDYMTKIGQFSTECSSRGQAEDLSAVRSCVSAMNSLNDHFRTFNDNTVTEFSDILRQRNDGSGSSSSSSSSNSGNSNSDYRVYSGGPFSEQKCREEPELLAAYCWK